jgi:SOS-response transcriptional repressor LexA
MLLVPERHGRPEHHLTESRSGGGTVGSMTLGERLRALIDAKNISHAWVAEQVGITTASLSDILTGKTENPSFFTVLGIMRAIGEPLSAMGDDPLSSWSAEELRRLNEFAVWLTQRTTREHAGTPITIPPRKKFGGRSATVHPVAASSGGVLYPDALEMPRKRIPAKYARMNANAVFSVHGESMIGEDIRPGDLLYVHRTPDVAAAIGRIVVCTVDDMVLVKRLGTRGRSLLLESANPAHPPMSIDEESSRFELIGVVVATSRT